MIFLAKPFEEIQTQVAELLKDKILVGHAVFNDLKVRHCLVSSTSSHFLPRRYCFRILGRRLWIPNTTRGNSN